MENLTMKEAQKILDDAPKGETHFYVSRLLKMGEVAYFSRGEGGAFVVELWVGCEMNLGCKCNSLDELRERLAYLTAMNDMREDDKQAEWVNGDSCSIGEYGNNWAYGCDVPNSDNCVVFRHAGESHMIISKYRLSKPETVEQKAIKARIKQLNNVLAKQVKDAEELTQSLIEPEKSNQCLKGDLFELESKL